MNYSANYNLNKPERNEQFNLDDWNNNTDAIDTAMNTNKTNIASNASNISAILTGLSTVNASDTSSVFYKLMKLVYPVGSLYWTSKSTNPSALFGGTWVQIKDKFILACGDTYKTTGATGGASTVTLSVSNMPSHSHSFTPSGTITMNAHSHGLNNHTHSFTPSGSVSGFTIVPVARYRNEDDEIGTTGVTISLYTRYGDFGGAGGHSGRYTKITYSPIFIGANGTTGGSSGNTTNTTSSGTFKGTAGTTGGSGSGTSFSIMPPYIVKYCWERTA